jgi:hypothetical protein
MGTLPGRLALASALVDGFVVANVFLLAYWASLPRRWPSDPLFPRLFVGFAASWYGWLVAACGAAVATAYQGLYVRWTLRFVNQRLPRRSYVVDGGFFAGLLMAIVFAYLLGQAGLALFFLVALGLLVPGFWPAYVLVGRWEREHGQRLFLSGRSFRAAGPPRLKRA